MSNDAIRTQTLQDQAIAWVVRAHASDMSDDDIIALSEWLEADPAHLAAYDAAERVWIGETPVAETAEVVDLAAARAGKIKKPVAPSRRLWLIAGSLAAGLAVLAILPALWRAQAPLIYETGTGQTREVALADGTKLHLNTATRLDVRYSGKRRDIVLDRGEVALEVAHDADRPLSVHAGDAVLRDVGTVFDVLRHDGAVTVTVRSGAVAMLRAGETAKVPAADRVLHAGDQAVIDEATGQAQRSRVMVGPGFDWQRGQAVYRNRSLAYVVSDLNRYFDKPIEVDAETGKLNVTAVLTLDSEASVVRHLQDFLPVEAAESDKAIILRRKP
ncbi:FecR family protein [Asticcacaulis taihuensis]|uniref:FecR family protein n=1 Tax=Asticcacaulis taihuensis TaxID=260084 RepID=UPI003F7B6852